MDMDVHLRRPVTRINLKLIYNLISAMVSTIACQTSVSPAAFIIPGLTEAVH
jgi:hypothetical protein